MKKMTKQNAKTKQRGQSLVEFAISLMVILLLLMGAVDFGIALFSWVTMRDAAQDGAIYGSVTPNDATGIRNRVIAAASDIITIAPGDITISYNTNPIKYCEGSTNSTPNTITVTVTHNHALVTPLVGTMIGSQTIRLNTQVTNTILRPVCP